MPVGIDHRTIHHDNLLVGAYDIVTAFVRCQGTRAKIVSR
jgi:hypothetical protein